MENVNIKEFENGIIIKAGKNRIWISKVHGSIAIDRIDNEDKEILWVYFDGLIVFEKNGIRKSRRKLGKFSF